MPKQSVLSLEELRMRPVEQSEEQRHRQLMAAHHYLGLLPKIGEALSCFTVKKPPIFRSLNPSDEYIAPARPGSFHALADTCHDFALAKTWQTSIPAEEAISIVSPFG